MAEVQKNDQLYSVSAMPDKLVTRVSAPEYAIGRWLNIDVASEPGSEAESDLVGETFYNMWKVEPEFQEDIPGDRTVNKALIEWMRETPGFEEQHAQTSGKIMSSAIGASMMWEILKQDENVQKALDKQKEAEQAEDEAEQARQELQQAAQNNDQEAVEQAKEKFEQAMQKAAQSGQEAEEMVQKLKKSPLAQAMMQSAVKESAEKAAEANAIAAGWGIEPGQMTINSTADVLRKLKDNPKLAEISKLAGRLKGISQATVQAAQRTYTGVVTEPDVTKHVDRLFSIERLMLSDRVPEVVRRIKLIQFLDTGLPGFKPITEGKIEGAFVGMFDGSGSMNGMPEIVAKAIALGVAGALESTPTLKVERVYELATFGYGASEITSVKSSQGYKEHLEWASLQPNGGTDFDSAFDFAIGELKKLDAEGKKCADLLFVTDGYCYLSPSKEKAWLKHKRETGARLIYVQIGGNFNDQIERIADTKVLVRDAQDFIAKAEQLTVEITENIVSAEKRITEAGD